MKRITQIAKLAVVLSGLCATQGMALDAPDYVRIRSISYAGSGCSAGTVAENVSPDKTAFTLLFDSYIAAAGPGISPLEKRKNCTLNIDLDFPQGWSFTIADIDYRGYASLERGVNALQKSTYYFQGDAHQVSGETTLRGSVDTDYHVRDELLLTAEVWSPCGGRRSLNINTQVRVDNSRNPRASGLMTVDTIDGVVTTIYNLKWKRCR
jgi:hypothetical protein